VLAESMVSMDIEVLKVIYHDASYQYMTRKEFAELTEEEKSSVYKTVTVVGEGQLLTIHDQEALDYGFATAVVKSEKDVFDLMAIDVNTVERVEFLWSEQLVRFIHKIAPMLMVIGMLALYLEFKVPGFGLPGIVGIICFAIVFGSKFIVGLATYTEILLFVIGIFLLFLEIFVIPGFGITGITGLFLIVLSLYLVSQSFVIPRVPWQFEEAKSWVLQFGISLICFFLAAALMTKLLPKSVIGKRIVLQETLSGKTDIPQESDYAGFLNQTGVTLSMLRPTGRARFADRIVDVISDSGYIPKSTPITVIRVDGKKVFVQETKQV
jgi:membrane-bound serine protease (ClpP class)